MPFREVEHNGSHRPDCEFSFPIGQAVAPVLVLDGEGKLLAASPAGRGIFGIADRHLGESLAQLEERVRPAALRLAIEDARTSGRETRVEELQLIHANGSPITLSFAVRPYRGSDGVLRLYLWGDDTTRIHDLTEELNRVRQELETTSEVLHTTNEELETTHEELQSTNEELEATNEELQSTNEELQSTNEELETTIEELQSTNEELATANDELRARQEELHDRDRFQGMILSSLRMGVIVVWANWEVCSWNRTCEDLWGAREEEVVGQNLFSLDTGMPFDVLRKPLLAAIQGETACAQVDVDAVNRRGKWIRCRMRIMPLLEAGGGPTGAMILIDDPAERN